MAAHDLSDAQLVARDRRVHLRPPREADEVAWLRLVESSLDFLAPWEPLPPAGELPTDPRRFHRMLDAHREGGSVKLLILRNRDEALLGQVNINNIVRGVAQYASLGYWIGAEHARQGHMGRALQLVLKISFDVLGLHRVEANIRPENEPSRRLVERAGFRLEGYSPSYLRIAGTWSDHERWALLDEEWKRR